MGLVQKVLTCVIGINVRRVEGLDSEYEHDVALIEGRYRNRDALQHRLDELNLLHCGILPTDPVVMAVYNLLKKELGIKILLANSIATNFDDVAPESIRVSSEKVYAVLERSGIPYLRHHLIIRSDGVYDNNGVSPFDRMVIVDQPKIADIN